VSPTTVLLAGRVAWSDDCAQAGAVATRETATTVAKRRKILMLR